MTITFQAPAILCRDLAISRRFYEELLGQQVERDEGPSIPFKGGFALWQVDHAFQTIYEHASGNTQHPGRPTYELHFETADAQAASIRFSKAGVELVHPLREMPWGKRILRVRDPDGHVVAVGEPMAAVVAQLLNQGMSAEAVAQRAALPIEIVEQTATGER
jgi:catechol 2,3-dioxygenase-like lactoylglutathione lyase family enzyme